MTTLTSIASLRRSPAIQSRVTTVENFLKRINPDWNAAWWFPISIINLSNGSDDCQWVRSHTSTHHKGQGNLRIGNELMSASDVINAMKGLTIGSEADLAKINTALLKDGWDPQWTLGFIDDVTHANSQPLQQEAGRSATPFVPTTTSSPSPRKRAAKSVKPIATQPAGETKLDKAKALFNDMTPKQKAEMFLFAQSKVEGSVPATQALHKLRAEAAA